MKGRFALIAIMIVNLLIVFALGACTPKSPEPAEHIHTYSIEWSSDRNNHWHNATCEHTDLKQDEAPHSFDENFKCQICDYTVTETAGLLREENDDGTWSIVGLNRYETETVIIIPEQYDGKDVTVIGESAFQNRTTMTDIVLPDTIQKIEAYAFYGCVGLTEVAIPDSVTYIGNDAFNGCEELQLLTMGNSVTEVYADAFNGCDALSMVDVGDLTNWCMINFEDAEANPLGNGGSVYENGVAMNSLNLPNTATIEKFAFYGSKITDVTIPLTTYYIGTDAFGKCDLLKEVNYPGELSDWCEITFDNTYANPVSVAHNLQFKGEPVTELDIPGTISEIGDYTFYGLNVTSLTLNPGIERIRTNAFRGCSGFTSLNIPRTIKEIGDFAFAECSDLRDLTLNDGLSTIGAGSFRECRQLYKVEIPDSISTIRSNTFTDCTNLTEVTIGPNVTAIQNAAFEGCFKLIEVRNLSGISLSKGAISNGYAAFYAHNVYSDRSGSSKIINDDDYLFYCSDTENYFLEYIGDNAKITLPEDISGNSYGIYQYAFSYNDALTDINIPETIISIGKNAFDNCKSLTYNSDGDIQYLGNSNNPYLVLIKADENVVSCEIKEGTKFITSYAFSSCADLKSVKFSNTIINLGEGAFEGCAALQEVTLSDSLPLISNNAFYNCTSLQAIEFPASVKEIGELAFANCTGISKLTIPHTVEKISTSSFALCDIAELSIGIDFVDYISLVTVKKLNITKGDVIKNEQFKNLDNIQEVRLCDSITEIGDEAFSDCTALQQISLPDNIEKIGSRVFYNCKVLSGITLPNTLTLMGDNVFDGCESLKGYTHGDVEYLGNSTNEYLLLFKINNKSIKNYASDPKTKFICDNAFNGCAELTDVTIGDGILSMGSNVFQNCVKLSNVTLGSGLKSLSNYAFSGCTTLQTIDTKAVESIGDYAFSGCTQLKNIVLSSNLNNFGSNVFQNCNNLDYYKDGNISYLGNPTDNFIVLMKATGNGTYNVKNGTRIIYDSAFVGSSFSKVTLPNGVKVICDSAFSGVVALEDINLPEGLVKVGASAFTRTSLSNFILPDSCIELGSNAIIQCSKLQVVSFGNIKSYVSNPRIPSFTDWEGYWFYGCSSIREVYMPCIEKIYDYSFYRRTMIRKLVIGLNLKEIGEGAFMMSSGSRCDLYYEGTPTQWNAILKGKQWNDSAITFNYYYQSKVHNMKPEV